MGEKDLHHAYISSHEVSDDYEAIYILAYISHRLWVFLNATRESPINGISPISESIEKIMTI